MAINPALAILGEGFDLDAFRAFLILPPSPPRGDVVPWVWFAPTLLPKFPDELETWMFRRFLAAGVAIAGIDVGESFGSPRGRAGFSRLYDVLTKQRCLSPRPALLARSRGGLMHYNWAVEHPTQVACVAGIFPVCDLRSFPGLERTARAHDTTVADLVSTLSAHNPVDRVAPLAQAGVPVLHLHGDRDEGVPVEANSAALAERYRAAGGEFRLLIIEGQGHETGTEFFRSPALVDFVLDHAGCGGT